MLHYSLTTHLTVQECEQKHEYRNVRRLRPFFSDFAPELGRLLHSYLAGYYASLRMGWTADNSHEAAMAVLESEGKKVTAAVNTAFFAGDEQTALKWNQLMPDARAIAKGYYLYRGQYDPGMYKVLYVEETIDAKISPTIRSRSILDLVCLERETDRTVLWEHKTTRSVPTDEVRLRDSQTLLYSTLAKRKWKVEIDKVVWNYMRTKLPAIPHLNKANKYGDQVMSKAAIDTTWDVYEQALFDANLDPDDYSDMRAKLYNAEYDSFYPRFEHVIVADPSLLLRDYVAQAKRTEALEKQWEAGKLKPIRHLTRMCSYCQFKQVCTAAVMGGDPEDVIKMRFSTPEQRNAPIDEWEGYATDA